MQTSIYTQYSPACSIVALFSTSIRTISRWPLQAAIIRGVNFSFPADTGLLISTLYLIRHRTTSCHENNSVHKMSRFDTFLICNSQNVTLFIQPWECLLSNLIKCFDGILTTYPFSTAMCIGQREALLGRFIPPIPYFWTKKSDSPLPPGKKDFKTIGCQKKPLRPDSWFSNI